MWLLSTSRAELSYFSGPEAVPGGYAILSHVWGRSEQSFQETQALQQRCATTGENPRDCASDKIRAFCELAEAHGYEWAWMDICCIDKTSSSELSEAINSMYRYYALAEVCYAYLFDVPAGEVKMRSPRAPTAFVDSKWHTRGWTLQELLAPSTVLFLSQEWTTLGTKASLAEVLWSITRIPQDVLRGERRPGDCSIAQRMSWAAMRQTTRLEDEAYCLMGIFDINMPTLYGEGRKAFRRLQEEIMKTSVDSSLFAWGIESEMMPLPVPEPAPSLSECEQHYSHHAKAFAESPRDFWRCGHVHRINPSEVKSRWPRVSCTNDVNENIAIDRLPSFTDTPHGVLTNILVFEIDTALFQSGHWWSHGSPLPHTESHTE
ncbi:hypothetical protein L226DRAFT_616177 [Lentinus tigrinus ALCF2SS1-7]|uniref:Uncharacterized protein n=1 Tax=Lentinus tigrinus ALCF2SS1-6 TaxID=1328759 RepID=A0A5C2S325_9APHY|nr:hypothetical protein L227DRAFT_655241 [Lentinus tigrinus ALCF2SS1-6]RPD70466.1 hypothetical protein L226DRAFT_616177 [Lentinus tigrinus ALCF2SS1-7]